MRGGWGGGRFLFVPFVFVRSEDSKRACPGHEGTAKWYIRQMFKQTPELNGTHSTKPSPQPSRQPHGRSALEALLLAQSATCSLRHICIGPLGELTNHHRISACISIASPLASLLHLDGLVGRVDDAASLGGRVLLPEGVGELGCVRVLEGSGGPRVVGRHRDALRGVRQLRWVSH